MAPFHLAGRGAGLSGVTGDRSLDQPPAEEPDRRARWDDAVEWIGDSAASLWSGLQRFVRAQVRSGKKLTYWILFAFAIATFAVAWMVAGTASEPTACEGLQALAEPDCAGR